MGAVYSAGNACSPHVLQHVGSILTKHFALGDNIGAHSKWKPPWMIHMQIVSIFWHRHRMLSIMSACSVKQHKWVNGNVHDQLNKPTLK